jgi:hypothetical protein
MTTHRQDQPAFRNGPQAGANRKNQAAQDGTGAEHNLSTSTAAQDEKKSAPSPHQAGPNQFPEKIRQDPNRDLSHVPGTFNPGNQAGKPVEGGGQAPAGKPGGRSS